MYRADSLRVRIW